MIRNWLKSSSCLSIHASRVCTLASGKSATAASSDSVVASLGSPVTFTKVNWFRGRSK